MAETSRLTMALVGCGNIARAHWRGIRYVADRIDVTAVVDTDEKRAQDMAERTSSEAFTSLREALAHGTFDAVDIMLLTDTGHPARASATTPSDQAKMIMNGLPFDTFHHQPT